MVYDNFKNELIHTLNFFAGTGKVVNFFEEVNLGVVEFFKFLQTLKISLTLKNIPKHKYVVHNN